MSFRDFLILASLKKHPTKVNTLKHILQGKRTSFQLVETVTNHQEAFFNSLPYSKRETYEEGIKELIQTGDLMLEDNLLHLTPEGSGTYSNFQLMNSLADPLAMRYTLIQKDLLDFYRLLLEYLSYQKKGQAFHQHGPASYLMMQLLSEVIHDRLIDFDRLLTEIYQAFQNFPEEWGNIFWGQIGGLSLPGLSDQVLSSFFPLPAGSSDWAFFQLLMKLENNCSTVADLNRLIRQKHPLVAETVLATARLFKSGCSITDIGRKRRIKLSTVYDHLFECQFFYPRFAFKDRHDATLLRQVADLEREGRQAFKEIKTKLDKPDLPYSYVLLARLAIGGGPAWH